MVIAHSSNKFDEPRQVPWQRRLTYIRERGRSRYDRLLPAVQTFQDFVIR